MMMKQTLRMELEEGSLIEILIEERKDSHYPMLLRTKDIVSGETSAFWFTDTERKFFATALLAAAGESEAANRD